MDLTLFIQYKKAAINMVIDALSRCKLDNSVWVINECIQAWVEILIQWYQDGELAKQLLTRLSLTTTNSQAYTLHQAYEVAEARAPTEPTRRRRLPMVATLNMKILARGWRCWAGHFILWGNHLVLEIPLPSPLVLVNGLVYMRLRSVSMEFYGH